jgi:hypothetical protein
VKFANIITCYGFLAVVIITLTSISSGLLGVLFFTSFVLGPFIINVFLSHVINDLKSSVILFSSSVMYIIWTIYVYVSAFYIHPDPQSPIALLFIGIYAVPVMTIFQIVAYRMNKRCLTSR